MKFYGHGMHWNSKVKKVLCKFVDGIYETDNEEEIEILKKYYKFDKDEINSNKKISEDNGEKIKKDSSEPSFQALKKLAKEKGINTHKMGKQEIISALEKVGE